MRKHNFLDALFPRIRQGILSTLLLQPDRRWYLSDLAKHLHVRVSSLQREIASLAEVGILLREADGNRIYYQANSRFPLFPELHGLCLKTIGLAGPIQDALQLFLKDIEIAFIYGSIAQGERSGESDIDVLIIGAVRMAELSLPLRTLEKKLKAPVNVILYTRDEFTEKLQQGHHFLQTVLQTPKIMLVGEEYELANIIGGAEDKVALDESSRIE